MKEIPIVQLEKLKDACQTLSSLPAPSDQIAARLQFIANLMADGAGLPGAAVLAWRGLDRTLTQLAIGSELVVGRQAGQEGITVPKDKLLSRRHFLIRAVGTEFVLQDLDSHNGTAINRTRNRVQQWNLHDGDLILAGEQVFAFLNPPSAT